MTPAKDIKAAGRAFAVAAPEDLRFADARQLKRMAAGLATSQEYAAIREERRQARGSKLDGLKSGRARL